MAKKLLKPSQFQVETLFEPCWLGQATIPIGKD
jgi:hypothetical protein